MSTENPNPSRNSDDEDVVRTFRKGNINFEFLQPGEAPEQPEIGLPTRRPAKEDAGKSIPGPGQQGKRGLFDRGRPRRTITRIHIFAWTSLCLFSLGGLVAIYLEGRHIVVLLAMPVLISSFLWSTIMLVLFLARPR